MKKILWGLVLLILLPIVAVIAINLFDEKLDPKAAAWGEPRAASVPEAENAYFVLIAMGTPDGGDGPAFARAWINEARAAARENRNEKHAEVKRAKRPDVCDPAKVSCLNAARDKKAELTASLEAYKEDLARYQTLIAAGRYEEVLDYPTRYSSTFPAYQETLRAQRAWLTQAALAAEAGDIEAAISAVERDLAFSRVMFSGARTLIGKMIAASRYWADLAFVSDLLQQKSAAMEPMLPRLRDMLKAIDPAALRMDAAMETEFGAIKHMFRDPSAYPDLGNEAGWLGKFGVKVAYKPNATVNLTYKHYFSMTAALNEKPQNIDAAFRKAAQPMTELGVWDYIDNPIAKMLLSIAVPQLQHYALRLHDLDAFNRLVTLRLEALAAKVGAEDAAAFAAKADAKLHDPYTGKPMAWDAAKTRYTFKPLGGNQTNRTFNMDAGGAFVVF